MGSPPGYVGYGRRVLTGPYGTLRLFCLTKREGPQASGHLLPGVRQGMMKDSEGRDIDQNSVIIMTSNAGAADRKAVRRPGAAPDAKALGEALMPSPIKSRRPSPGVTLNSYLPLSDEDPADHHCS